jgi:hypothetical protein
MKLSHLGPLMLFAGSHATKALQPRDLSRYDVVGPFKIDYHSLRQAPEPLEARLREFLWTHWREHRLGTVVVTRQYVEGLFRMSYFVEPDEDGKWAIVEDTVNMPLSVKPELRFSCTEFERVTTDRLRRRLMPIPDSESISPRNYLLHPKCSQGEFPKLW